MNLLQEITSMIVPDSKRHSLDGELKVTARPKDVEEIASLLLLDSHSNNPSYPVSVFPIVGMPGSGKISLAYLLFHHQGIKDHFDQRVWLHWNYIASTDSAEEILQVVTQKYFKGMLEMDFDAKYLLVIEGFSDKGVEKWVDCLDPLLSAFARCKPGTKIIVTSSSEPLEPHVLSKIPLVKGAPYQLRPLQQQHEDSLAFFKSIAFRDIAEEDRNPHLNITLEIFNKCTNILGAIRIISSILSSQPPSKWQCFNDDILNIPNPGERILSIRNLIVQNPNFFYYHSLFPPDYKYSKVEVKLFLNAHWEYSESLEKEIETLVGNDENSSESCLRDENGAVVYYKLQVLVHEMVKHFAPRHYCLIENYTEEAKLSNIEHLSMIVDSRWRAPIWVERLRSSKLDSLLLLPSKSCEILAMPTLETAIIDFINLLFFGRRLRSLRYLKLGVSTKSLLECITEFVKSLQTLDLRHSKVQELPGSFHKLRHLKHLYVGDRLIDLPPKFGELTELQTLDVFIVGNNNGLDALACLTFLAGKLRIRYQNGREVHVLPEDTTFLKNRKLYELSLEWSYSNAEPAAEKYKKEYNMELKLLQPPSTLKVLTAKGWKGETFPQLDIDCYSSLLNNLVYIHISECSRCKHLPSFNKLGFLKSLKLWGLIALEWIENCVNNSTVASDETPSFSALEHLSLVNLPQLKGWSRVEENQDYKQEQRNFPRLHDLRLSGCPELISMPHTPNLHSLEASNCHRNLLQQFFSVQASSAASSSSASAVVPVLQNLRSLKLSDMSTPEPLPRGLEYLTTLEELSLSWLYNLRVLPESIGHLIQLRQLAIRYLPNLLDLPESLSGLTALQHVEIRYCPRLKQIPSYFSELISLKRLQIKECVILERRCQKHDGEDWHLIQHIPEVFLG